MSKQIRKYLNYTILFAASFLLTLCNNKKGKTEQEIESRTPVTVVEPVFKNVTETIEFPAVTSYQVKNIIRSSTAGVIESVEVNPGENIIKGNLLFTLKTLEASALQEKTDSDTNLGFKGIIKIFSPKDGIVSAVSHQTGDFVQAGDELATISDSKSLIFILEVPYEMTGIVEKNKECSIRLPDNTLLRGRIHDRLPEMNIQNQTVSYIVKPEISRQLPQNLIAIARLTKSIKAGVQVFPKAALLGDETQTEFWVMKLANDSTAVKIPVIKGNENLEEVEITEPLFLPSDKILVSGNYGLSDTASVVLIK